MNSYKQTHLAAHMQCAKIYAELSKATRLKVGSFLVRGDKPLAMGWNGTLPGEPNVCEDCNGNTLPSVRHAEINSLNKLRRSTETAEGAIMCITHAPCLQCALDMIDSRILGVVYEDEYRDTEGIKKLLNHGITVYKYNSQEKFFSSFIGDEEGFCIVPKADNKTNLEFNQWF